ncbi:T9SS type A sorting domain-containing protein [Bacteroidota bacterium]|nr:T9SS type A sorting domain-containing protein [Bacteroidota bacterium]
MKKFTILFLLLFSFSIIFSQDLTLSGGTLTIEKTGSLTMTGNFTNSSGTVTLNSDADEFAVIKVGGSASGNITYNRWVNAVGTNEWDLIGSPVDGLSISDFANTNTNGSSPLATNGSQYAIGYYDNSIDEWTNYTTGTIAGAGNFDIGKGYQMGTDSGATLAFTGSIATTDQTQAVQDHSGSSGRIWNLVANPYPIYLNANTNADASNNFLSVNGTSTMHDTYVAIYGYDADGSGFSIYNNTSSATYIAPGQAFMVAADNASAGTAISLTEAMQTTTGGDDFISGDVMENTEVIIKLFNDDNELDSTKLFFFEGLTYGLDPGFDAGHYDDNAVIMTRLVEEDEGYGMAINAMGLDAMENAVIPLVVNQAAGQEFRINLFTATIPDPNVYLEDVEEGTFTNLYEGDFVLTPTSDLEGVGRFFIHMTADTMSNEEVSTSMLNAYKEIDASYITIEGLATQSNETKVSLYNILGREVLATTLNNNMGTQTISTVGLSAGIYVIELESGSDRLTKKLLIK